MFGNTSIWEDFKLHVLKSGNTLYHLIFINVLVFVLINLLEVILVLFELDKGLFQAIWNNLAISAYPVEVLLKPWTLVTYMFVHSGFWHILFNMLILFWFGRILREYLGDKKLLSTYFIGGLAGAVMYLLAYQFIPLLNGSKPLLGMVGASAGVLSVLVAAATLLPNFGIRLLLIGTVKLKYIALVLIIVDLLSLAGGNAGGHFAHLGGAIYGFFFVRQLQQGTDLGRWFVVLTEWINSLFGKINLPNKEYSFKVHHADGSRKPRRSNQDEIDRILDKIAESGYDSLSQDEKDTLFRASKDG